jgi:hypothetical protein
MNFEISTRGCFGRQSLQAPFDFRAQRIAKHGTKRA